MSELALSVDDIMQSLANGPIHVQDHVILHMDRPIGILNPGTLFGIDQMAQVHIHGPFGQSIVEFTHEDIWAALIATGSVLLGEPHEVVKVAYLLQDELLSRTTSYLCCVAKSCHALIENVETLRKTRIGILGCGGVGSIASVLLAGAGIRNLRLVDPDIIEKSNLNRQILWSTSDIGQPKVDVLQRRLLERFGDLSIEKYRQKITGATLVDYVSGVDVVLLTADDPIGLVIPAQELASKHGFMLFSTGYSLREAGITVGPVSYDEFGGIQWSRGPFAVMPSFGPTNAELGGLASSLIIHYLLGRLPSSDLPLNISWDATVYPRHYL